MPTRVAAKALRAYRGPEQRYCRWGRQKGRPHHGWNMAYQKGMFGGSDAP
jgi:hypothetical protein